MPRNNNINNVNNVQVILGDGEINFTQSDQGESSSTTSTNVRESTSRKIKKRRRFSNSDAEEPITTESRVKRSRLSSVKKVATQVLFENGKPKTVVDIPAEDKFIWSAERENEYINSEERISWISSSERPIPSKEELESFIICAPSSSLKAGNIESICDSTLVKVLRKFMKEIFMEYAQKEIESAKMRSNPFEMITNKGNNIFQNRSALKMANIDGVTEFLFTYPTIDNGDPLVREPDLLYFADLCGGPGGFTEYVLWRKKWGAKGFGFTLKDEDLDWRLDDFKAASTETFEAHYGSKNDGDIYNPDNLISFKEFVLEHTNRKGVHFVMADGGFDVTGNEEVHEQIYQRMYLCQFQLALAILRVGGNFVCKLMDTLSASSVALIYLVYLSFDKISIIKPNTSRPANSEKYIICRGKKSDIDSVVNYLFCLNLEFESIVSDKADKKQKYALLEIQNAKLFEEDTTFFNYIKSSNESLVRRQTFFIYKIRAFVEDPDLSSRNDDLITKCLQRYKIPTEVSYPATSDPEERFIELVRSRMVTEKKEVPNRERIYVFKPEKVKDDTLMSQLKTQHSYKAIVVGEDPTKSIYNTPIPVRGFLTIGEDHSCLIWNGQPQCAWYPLECKLNFPKDTVLFVEVVNELRGGEDFIETHHRAIHIIDALFLGGKDVRHKKLDKRLALVSKMIKATTLSNMADFIRVRVKKTYELRDVGNLASVIVVRKLSCGDVRLFYSVNDRTFIRLAGILIIPLTNDKYYRHWSRTQEKYYYINKKTNRRIFEMPQDATADVFTSYQLSKFWNWDWKSKRGDSVEPEEQKVALDTIEATKVIESRLQ